MKPKDPKRCTKCGEHKPRAEFYPHSKAKNGLGALRESPSLLSKAIEYLEVGNGIRG